MKAPYFAPQKPRFLGHRGAAGHAPENTLLSFETAAKHVDYLETDAWLSKDGTPVFLHDESLLRTCGIDRKISELNCKDLQNLDAAHGFSLDGGKSFPLRGQGHKVPSVESIVKSFPDKFFNIELKDPRPGASEALIETLSKCHALDRVLLAAENDSIMQSLRASKPAHVPTSASYGEVFAFLKWIQSGAPKGAYTCEAQAFQIPNQWEAFDLAKPEMIAQLHAMGIEVHYWTINDKALITQLLAAGADGIVTDFPELARDFRP